MKAQVRKQMRQALGGIEAEAAAAKSRAACARLAGRQEFRDARVVMLYLHIAHELDVAALALAGWQDDKTILVPKVNYEQRHMIAVEIRSLDTDLAIDPYGVREPITGEPCPEGEIDLVAVPALAFDRAGNRLGRGAGFYDRFLSQPDVRAMTCGIGFAEQVLDELPVQNHDVPLKMLVTDEEVLRFS